MTTTAVFRDPRWLRQHLLGAFQFYYPACVDTRHGGFVAQIRDLDGSVYDSRAKHLVSQARFTHNFALGALLGGPDYCLPVAEHGVSFLLDVLRDDDGGYPWVLDGRTVTDDRRATYGHAFVLLALSTAARAGVDRAEAHVERTADLLEERFWEPDHGAYRSDLDAEWTELEPYRGQNANMHLCEAMLGAYEATGETRYLDRAETLADTVCRRLADRGDGLVWEHYTADWAHDWGYNEERPDDLFRPWGYQVGHLLEWAKLLALVRRHGGEPWMDERATHFFEVAVRDGWDDEYGGFHYSLGRDHEPVVTDKYFWELAEGLSAAAVLGDATGEASYWTWYDRIWEYTWETFVNERYGNWYAIVTREGALHEDRDPTPKVKSGYHRINGVFEVLNTLGGV